LISKQALDNKKSLKEGQIWVVGLLRGGYLALRPECCLLKIWILFFT
jgi:hypothetical protein